MIKTRGRKILGDILARKGRTILVVLSITIGVFGVGTLVGSNDLFLSQIKSDLNKENIAMTHVYLTTLPGTQLSLEDNVPLLETLAVLPDVTRVEGQAIYPVNWKRADEPADAPFSISDTVLAYSEPFGEVELEPVSRVVDGRYPVAGQNEIAIEQRLAMLRDLGIGDKLLFQGGGGSETQPAEWEIVGIVFHPYFTISIAEGNNIDPEDQIFMTYEDAQSVIGFQGLASIYVRYTDVETARNSLNQLMEAVSTQTPYIPIFSWIDDPDDSFIIGQVVQVTSVLNILAIVAMAVSGFLVANIINTTVAEQKKQIGVMKLLGASRLDNLFIYGGMALSYGAIGTFFGTLLAVPAAYWMAKTLGIEFNLLLLESFKLSTQGVAVGIGMGLLVPLLAAAVPVFMGTRVSILDAMTDQGITSNWGQSRLSRFIGRLPLPISARQALSNVAQKKGRLALTGITLTLAVGAFMGVTGVFQSLTTQVQELFDTFNFEIQVAPQEAQNFDEFRMLIANNLPEAENIFPGYGVSVDIQGYESAEALTAGSSQLNASGIDTTSPIIQFDLIEGTGWLEDPERSGVIITRPLADKLEKTVGDSVTLTVRGQTHEFEIIGIDSFPFDNIFFDWRELATISGYVDADGNPLPDTFYVTMAGDPGVEGVDAAIETLSATLQAENIRANFTNQPLVAEQSTEDLGIFSLILNLTSAVMALVGAIGLLATLSMSVFERQKEIGVMRSIGAGSSTIIGQFLIEGLLVGSMAWLVGIPLSLFLGRGILSSIDDGNGVFTFEYSLIVLVIGLIGILVLAAIASIWPSVSAGRKTVADILRYQ